MTAIGSQPSPAAPPEVDLLGWLSQPSATAGLHTATADGQWEHRSYRQLADDVVGLAAGLRRRGVQIGDRVVVMLPAGAPFAASFFGIVAAGAVPVPVAPPHVFQDQGAYHRHLRSVLAAAQPSLAIWMGGDGGPAVRGPGPLPGTAAGVPAQGVAAGRVVSEESDTVLPWVTVADVLAPNLAAFDLARLDLAAFDLARLDLAGPNLAGPLGTAPNLAGARPTAFDGAGVQGSGTPAENPAGLPGRGREPVLVQFTSGSSGMAKGVVVPGRALAANVGAIGRWLGFGPGQSVVSWLPVHHDMGLVGCLVAPICHQLPVWTMAPEHFIAHPERWLACVAEQESVLSAMPAFGLAHLLRRVPEATWDCLDLSGIRGVVLGAERCDATLLGRAAARLRSCGAGGGVLLPAYGLAEATLAVTGVFPGQRLQLAAPPGQRQEMRTAAPPVVGCGRPLDSVAVEIHTAGGVLAGDGEVGEIVVSGASVASGYCQSPGSGGGGLAGGDGPGQGGSPVTAGNPLTGTRFEGGQLHTGDAGFMVDGQLFVVGRFGDSIKVRGRSVFSEDLELAMAHAGLRSNRVAVALGERDGVPLAVVMVEDGEAGADHVVPRVVGRVLPEASVNLVHVGRGDIPRTSSGKPRRRQLWQFYGPAR